MLKVYQIYFKEEQLPLCDYIPYHNKNCTVFFENSVIKELVENKEHVDYEYFGVVSYKLREKIGIMKNDWKGIRNISNTSTVQFTPESFQKELFDNMPDVMSFQRHVGHDPITFGEQYHPGLIKYFREIMSKIGYDWSPTHFDNIFYCNYFVAKGSIYEKYVKEMLIPAMEVMSKMPELMANSYYPRPLPDHLKLSFGVNHYPFHAFICERMFSYFAWIHNYKCLHY